MKKTRRKFTGAFKASVALEAIKGKKTMAELSQQFDVNAVMISKWKTEFLENMGSIFESGKSDSEDSNSSEMDKLYAQIGQLKVENDFLKKSCKKLGI
jgi:transposase-like protein